MPLTQKELNAAGCGTPFCGHDDHSVLHLHARCHPRANTAVSYEKATGILTVKCAKCDQLIAEIAVADGQ